MRNTDERIAAIGQRTKEIKQQQKLLNNRIVALSSIAAAIAFVVGIGVAMPGIMAQMEPAEKLGVSGMASIFSAGGGMGYVMIAVIAFTLGVCVTVLCLHLNRTDNKADPHKEKGEEHHG